MKSFFKISVLFSVLIYSCNSFTEKQTQQIPVEALIKNNIYDSGGEPISSQSKYDVSFYDLNLTVDPDKKWIGGTLEMYATTSEELDIIIIHLDTLLKISKVNIPTTDIEVAGWNHQNGLIFIKPVTLMPVNTKFSVKISYSGNPLSVKDAKRRSWSDGFYFAKTPDGEPWVSNVSVLNGADIWFPCKDHPSDEPDSMAIIITVPKELVVASNGVLRGISDNENKTRTHHWFVDNPINNYAVTINIAPYKTIEETYTSVTGETFPFIFWAIPEDYELAKSQFPNFIKEMRYLEETLGPYPFRNEKYGIAETYYFGMETQSIIAYGSDFTLNKYGFDYLHFHELVHEWFANMVTAEDWKHWWIHESFATYLEPLYAEHLGGEPAYHNYMADIFARIKNKRPIVLSKPNVSAREGYHGDVYGKGAAVLHTLRYLIGKEKMLQLLRTMAYPDPALEKVTDGSQTRFSTTEEFVGFAEKQYGAELDWFFDAYLYHAEVPQLVVSTIENKVNLSWETPSNYPFTLAVPVEINGIIQQVEMPEGHGAFIADDMNYEIDPQNLILKEISVDAISNL